MVKSQSLLTSAATIQTALARGSDKNSTTDRANSIQKTLSDFAIGGCLMGEMQEKSDAQLLRDYAEHRNETAFRELVNRHADAVYASALRQVSSPDLAQDIAQGVFTDLARKAQPLAGTLTGDASLLGWLFRSTRFLALNQLRDDRRRQARERHAMQHFDPASETAPEWECVQPVLDDAMADLSDEDRDALLLRFFKNRNFRAIGAALGVSDDAAQKRVTRALERLRTQLTSRGVTTTAAALSTVLATNAVPLAPVGLAATLSTAALAGTTLATTATTLKTLAMTTLQKTVITATLAIAAGVGVYEVRQSARLRDQVESLHQQQSPLTNQIKKLTNDLDDATRQLADLRDDNERLNQNTAELLKLRGETGRLRKDAKELAQLKAGNAIDPVISEAVSWKERVKLLKQHLEQNPGAKIPELQFATDQDWLNATQGALETERDYRRAMSGLRNAMENRFAGMLQPALNKFMNENNNQFPTELSQLQPYFKSPVDEAILQRYAILPKEEIPNLGMGGNWIISPRSLVDQEFDSRVGIGPNGYGSSSDSWSDESGDLASARKILSAPMKTYTAANNGNEPTNPSQLLPYLTSAEQQEALQKLIQAIKAKTQSSAN